MPQFSDGTRFLLHYIDMYICIWNLILNLYVAWFLINSCIHSILLDIYCGIFPPLCICHCYIMVKIYTQ